MKRDRTKANINRYKSVVWHKKELCKYVDKHWTVPDSMVRPGNRLEAWGELFEEGYFKGKKYEVNGEIF